MEFTSAAEFAETCVAAGHLGVLRGGVADWPAMRKWTPAYLALLLPNKTCDVLTSPDAVFRYHETASPRRRLSVAEAVGQIARPQPGDAALYMAQQSLDRDLPELAADVAPPPGLPTRDAFPFLWLGSAATVTPLHYDGANNLFGQVSGRKRFTIFRPADTDNLYPLPPASSSAHFAAVDVERPDLDRYERFADAQPIRLEVGPGDLLSLPAFYWHHVRSLTLAISVNYWWAPNFEQCLVPQMLSLLRVSYRRDQLAEIGRPIADFPGGLPAAASAALARGAPELAVLLAGAAATQCDGPPAVRAAADAVAAGAGCSHENARTVIAELQAALVAGPFARSSPRET